MSETNLSSSEIEKWLEGETHSILSPVQAEAKQFRDEMKAAIQSEIEISKMLLDNSTKEIDQRNMRVYNRARALNKLAHLFLERLKKIGIPEQVTYENLNRFAQEAQKVFMVADIDIKNWFPRVSPFFIMDRRKFLTVHEKAKLTLASFNNFLTKEYVKTKTLEEAFGLLTELHSQEKQKENLALQLENMKKERIPLEQKIGELEKRVFELRNQGPISQLKIVQAEEEALSNELRNVLRHLQKPFLKIQALAYQGGGAGLTQDELKKLDEYLEKPLEAFAREEIGYPNLRETLAKIYHLIKQDKLKLKPDKARKAEQSIDNFLHKDSLNEIHRKSIDVVTRKNRLIASSNMSETMRELSLLEEQLELVRARKASAETHQAVTERAIVEAQERIHGHKQTIEKTVYSSLGKKIRIL